MISIVSQGSFAKSESFLQHLLKRDMFSALDRYGQQGVNALANATPKDSGETAASWTYEVQRSPGSYAIIWSNTNVVAGKPIAIMLQYGHGTGTGGYVSGRDYINPPLRPLFDKIAADVWKEVMSA